MADVVFNTALGRMVEWCQDVEDNVPAGALLRVHAWVITATDANVVDVQFIDELEAVALVTEATPYTNQTLAAAGITITVDDSGEKVDVDLE